MIGALVVGGLLSAAVATYQLAPALPTSAPTSATQGSVAAPTTVATVTMTATPAPPAPSTETGLPDGPGTTEPGILVLAAPNPDASFTVTEMIRLPSPVSALELKPPRVTRAWGNDLADVTPRAVQVQASAGKQPLAVPDAEVAHSVSVPIAIAVDTFMLQYRLEGTVVRTVPSTAGRALGAVTSLTGGMPDDLPVVVVVSGAGVLNLTCPTRDGAAQLCATGDRPRLRVSDDLPWRRCLVIVQLDLPMPR